MAGEACCGEWEPKQDEEGVHAGWLSSVGCQCAQDEGAPRLSQQQPDVGSQESK